MRIAVSGMTVFIGMPIYGGVPQETAISLFKTARKCAAGGVGVEMTNIVAPYIHIARDMVVDEFLKGDAQKLFFIDHDESWEANEFLKLVALSTMYDVVGAVYPLKRFPLSFSVQWLPDKTPNEHGLIKVAGMPMGFTIVDRSVLETMAAQAPRVRHHTMDHDIANIFRLEARNGGYEGEDMAFFKDVRALGIDVWLDPNVSIGHVGSYKYQGKVLEAA